MEMVSTGKQLSPIEDIEASAYDEKENERNERGDTLTPAQKAAFYEPCCYGFCIKQPTGCCCGSFVKHNDNLHCVLFCLMVAAFLVAIIIPMTIYSLANNVAYDALVIDSTNSDAYAAWKTNQYGDGKRDAAVIFDLRLFDVLNPHDIVNGSKPIVNEVGPYSYDEYRVHFDVSFPDNGNHLVYSLWKYYVFNATRTGDRYTENDNLTLPYAAALGFQAHLGSLPPIISQGGPFFEYSQTVDEKLSGLLEYLKFGAYTLNLTASERSSTLSTIQATNASKNSLIQSLNIFFAETVAAGEGSTLFFKQQLCGVSTITAGGITPFWVTQPGKAWFGYLNDPLLTEVKMLLNNAGLQIPWTTSVPGPGTNYTSLEDARRRTGPSTTKSGKDYQKHINQYLLWDNSNKSHNCANPLFNSTPYIEGEEFPSCPHFQKDWTDEQVVANGYIYSWATDEANSVRGSDGGIFGRVTYSETIQVFLFDIFRKLYLRHTGNLRIKGINTRKYQIQIKDLQNVESVPEHAAYYQYGPNGLLNFTHLSGGAPGFLSLPHFLDGDESLVDAIIGLHPNPTIHETYLLIEPETGILAKARKRLQSNLLLTSLTFPNSDPALVPQAEGICANLDETTGFLLSKGLDPAPLIGSPSCASSLVQPVECYSLPLAWKFYNGQVFFPLGWGEEFQLISDSKADKFGQVESIVDTANGVREWFLIFAVLLFTMQLGVICYRGGEIYEVFFGPENNEGEEDQLLQDDPNGSLVTRPKYQVISNADTVSERRENAAVIVVEDA